MQHIRSLGWRDSCLILGAAIFVFGFAPPLLFLPEFRGSSNAARMKSSFRSICRSWVFWLLIGGFFLFSIGINGIIAHLIPLLTDRGLSASTAAFAASMLGVLTFAGRLLTGALLDRFPGSRVGALFFAMAASGIAALSQVNSIWAAYAYAAAGLIGLGMGAEADIMPYLISRYFAMDSFSEIYGYSFTAYAVAAAFGPLLMAGASIISIRTRAPHCHLRGPHWPERSLLGFSRHMARMKSFEGPSQRIRTPDSASGSCARVPLA